MSEAAYQPGLRAGGGRRTRKKATPGASTEFRGVSRRPSGRYGAQIRESKGGVRSHRWLGCFDTAEDAARAYDAAAVELHGEAAVTNFEQLAPIGDGGETPLLAELSGQEAGTELRRGNLHRSAGQTWGSKGKAALSLGGSSDLTPAECMQVDELLMDMDSTDVSNSISAAACSFHPVQLY
ncbi:hypothetical protein QYE76_020436 [Lolium multiflorum]|uniref:AP2/ERF domain-containing protein n=1 Tax=Lolium multiflorum TaxID=4521 RepID=A0AAD8R7Q7_LOLMU|nr:hypothetical protein QYE76_020436 [Lolium multiflorum]